MVDDEGKARNQNFTGHPGLANQISKNNVCKLYFLVLDAFFFFILSLHEATRYQGGLLLVTEYKTYF